jgi:hypothetical protein
MEPIPNRQDLEELLNHPNIKRITYDEEWIIPQISKSIWKPELLNEALDQIEKLKTFLSRPYIEDIFEKDEASRSKWQHYIAHEDPKLYSLNSVNCLRINSWSSLVLTIMRLQRYYMGNNPEEFEYKKETIKKLFDGPKIVEYRSMEISNRIKYVKKLKKNFINSYFFYLLKFNFSR